MMFEQCKIVIFNNIIFMKQHRKIFQKNSMEIFQNFPEKYEIFRLTSLLKDALCADIYDVKCLYARMFLINN